MTLDRQIGGAVIICYLRDLITATPYQTFSKEKLLVLLETLTRDTFPDGIGEKMWEMGMTNEELDKICCEFAGIKPLTFKCPMTGLDRGSCATSRDPEQCAGCDRYERSYPPVSTDWRAAGRLIEAMHVRGIEVYIQSRPKQKKKYTYAAYAYKPRSTNWKYSDSGPMALALAVCELAKAQK